MVRQVSPPHPQKDTYLYILVWKVKIHLPECVWAPAGRYYHHYDLGILNVHLCIFAVYIWEFKERRCAFYKGKLKFESGKIWWVFSFSSVQLLSCVWLFLTPWTAAHQASLSITNSQSLLKLTSIESVMPSNHLILYHPLLLSPSIFPSIRSFPMSQFFALGGQRIGVSASISVLPMNIQDWFPLGWTGWISLLSKGLLRVFSNTTVQKHQFFSAQLSLQSNSQIHAWLLEKP